MPTYNLLKDDRAAGRLVFLPTTLAKKRSYYLTSRTLSLHYGPAADPFPIVKNLRKNINTVSDEELQLGLTDAFVRIRDHHTRWSNIAPYSCFYATTEVEFTFIEGDADIINKPTVVVTSTSTNPEVRPLFGEGLLQDPSGDELLAVNGLSFVEWFEQNQFTSGAGANEFGGQRAGLGYLTTIYGGSNRLPSEDSITFQFKSEPISQNSYTVKIPAEQPGNNHESDTTHLSPRGYKMRSLEDFERETVMKQSFSPEQKSAVSMNPTDVTEVTWGIYKPGSANMGIIKLDSFSPEDVETKSLAVEKAIMIIRSLLANELKNTNSVIYELRGNPGGNVRFAEGMVQLFKPDFKPFGSRYLLSNITYSFFVNGKDPNVDPLAKAWQETKPGSRYSNVFSP
ncbi:hypothetical protein BASA62_006863 [Batrachochytrium salamandrivorans]|nr:hypothetical protein BASA62_006863 [Batrachochytrium salamandrivorans]